jgi:hypothetical protein
MATIQQALEAEIASLEADLGAKKAALEKLKAEAGDFISREVSVVEGWVRAVRAHLFHTLPAQGAASPQATAAQQ